MPGSFADPAPSVKWGALLISICLHLVIFMVYANRDLPAVRTQVSQPVNLQPRIYAELILSQSPEPEAQTPASQLDDSKDIAPIANEVTESLTQSTSDEVVAEITTETEPVETRPIVLDYTQAQESSWITQDSGPQAGKFGQVFDPRLRQKLQRAPARKSATKPASLKETNDIHGNLYVDVGKGRCLMVQEPMQPGEPTNWYMTACDSGGDEGEQMLQRVEKNWRLRGE